MIVNLFILIFSLFIFITFILLLIFFKEFYYSVIYLLITWFLIFMFIYKDSLHLLNYWISGIGENLIIQDASDIIWAMIFISCSYSFIFIFPYFLFLLYNFFFNSMFTKERLLFLKIILFLIYMEFIILYILFNDIYYSSFFDVSNLNLNFFELQIEIDNFLYLIFSFFLI